MQTYRVDHIHLISPAIESTKAWYHDNLDAKVTLEGDLDGIKFCYLDFNGFNIILHERLPDEMPLAANIQSREGVDHFGLAVADLSLAEKELLAKGIKFITSPTRIRPGLRIAYIEAPDKVRIELVERK